MSGATLAAFAWKAGLIDECQQAANVPDGWHVISFDINGGRYA